MLVGVWIAPDVGGSVRRQRLIASYMNADCSYCDSGCVWSGRKRVLVGGVVLAKMAMAGV